MKQVIQVVSDVCGIVAGIGFMMLGIYPVPGFGPVMVSYFPAPIILLPTIPLSVLSVSGETEPVWGYATGIVTAIAVVSSLMGVFYPSAWGPTASAIVTLVCGALLVLMNGAQIGLKLFGGVEAAKRAAAAINPIK